MWQHECIKSVLLDNITGSRNGLKYATNFVRKTNYSMLNKTDSLHNLKYTYGVSLISFAFILISVCIYKQHRLILG